MKARGRRPSAFIVFEWLTKAMEIFLTAYSFVQSSGSSWEHKVRASMAASLEKTEPASRVAHEGRPQ